MDRQFPDFIEGYGPVKRFAGAFADSGMATRAPVRLCAVRPGASKVLPSIRAAIEACGLTDGATVSFHHHLRNGDDVLRAVMAEIAALGLRDIRIAPSSLFPVHAPLVDHIRSGVVTGISTAYMAGPVAEAVARGWLATPAVMQTHGGRARAIESGDLPIDVAFVAAPTADTYGNLNGVEGKSACGTLGYPMVDAKHARRVVAITDNLVSYPACPIDITQEDVDYVVAVDSIGDPRQIVSGSTRVTDKPDGLKIAATAARVIAASGLLKDGFSFQTGAGGVSLATAACLRDVMVGRGIVGSFAAGGITGTIVEMFQAGLFRTLFNVQCFDLKAVESYRRDAAHQSMSASMYANPHNKGAVVNQLDAMVLGAAEVDLDFNVNVTLGAGGLIIGGSGGHSDTAAGAKLALVTTKLTAKSYPKIVDRVACITTPGETIDVVVTDEGVAVNPQRPDLRDRLLSEGLSVVTIGELREKAMRLTGEAVGAAPKERSGGTGRIVAVAEYRDGTVIDLVEAMPG
ncbi:citrate lyase subunit alpha/citrate CoA-transferase [Skermanella aerolata]|uniref:citrate lyase subunit alpha n=1 Tax=Skermanella aerolata TaxID=393310 RepID=UPI003D1EC853